MCCSDDERDADVNRSFFTYSADVLVDSMDFE